MPGMTPDPATAPNSAVEVRLLEGRALRESLDVLGNYVSAGGVVPLSRHPRWLAALEDGLGHTPFALEAVQDGRTRGILPLALVSSLLFGRFLVSLPYLNYGGVVADDDETALALIDRAVTLADRLGVRHLELRHERPIGHPALTHRMAEKVHMRLDLPATVGTLWDQLPAKVRNQVRKPQKLGLTAAWGGPELLPEFHAVFSHNMRDLGTPTYGRRLFEAVLRHFEGRAELCIVRSGGRAAAAGLLVHGWGVSEVLSAGAIRHYNPTNANMLLYWHLLERSIARCQSAFDFGRSTRDGTHFRFKKQWGAIHRPAEWQYYVRSGDPGDLRPGNSKFRLLINIWRGLPVGLTRFIGPPIVRRIP